jgi:hypothetical protein
MLVLIAAAFIVQAAAMFFDELRFHRRRGLPRWERIGHPLDTCTVLACYTWLLATRPSETNAVVYVALVMLSSLFVTKDELVHATRCSPGEQWVHALLFVLHPLVLLGAGWLWWTKRSALFIVVPLASTAAFAGYQIFYWNPPRSWPPAR